MASLFLDTTDHLIVGILNDQYEWCHYCEIPESKTAHKLHSIIYKILQEQQIMIKNIQCLFHISGPGSYTGMRLSEGFSQVCTWQGMVSRSLYHFEVPLLLEHPSGAWVARAFKGEYFLYCWDHEKREEALVDENKLNEKLLEISSKGFPVFTHFISSLASTINKTAVQETGKMVRDCPQQIFSQINDHWPPHRPYYYRVVEKEFRQEKAPRFTWRGKDV
jgi:tRNA threonylcarbamoyladenosine biosynthesis protein TsaB